MPFPYTFPFEFYVEYGGIWCFIDWDGDGDFGEDYEDVSPYLRDFSVEHGLDFDLGHAVVGQARITLKDLDDVFIPCNTASPLYGNILPGRKVVIQRHYKGTTYTLFTGYLSDIRNDPYATIKECYITATDGSEKLSSMIVEGGYGTNMVRVNDDSFQIMAALMMVSDGGSTAAHAWTYLDDGPITYPLYVPIGGSYRENINMLENVEGSRWYIRPDGEWAWEDINHRTDTGSEHITSQWTVDGTVWHRLKPVTPWSRIKNRATFQFTPYIRGSTTVTVWSLAENATNSNSPLFAPGETKYYTMYYYADGQRVYVHNFAALSSGTDFTANSSISGGGASRTSEFDAYVTDTGGIGMNFGDVGRIRVVNTSTTNSSYLTLLQLRGQHYESQDPVKIISEDTSSMDTYQIREVSYSMGWSVASTDMQTVADWYIDEYAQPVPTFKVDLLPVSSDCLQNQLNLDISSRVTVQDSRMGLDRDFFIEHVQHSWDAISQIQKTTWLVTAATA